DSWNLEKPEHFNQTMMFPVDGIDNTQIKQAIEELVKHHDMLRAVYRNQQLEILPISESKLCDFYEFDYRGKDDVKQAIQERCSEIQASINLETGSLVKIAVFETDHDKVMMFCVHHLAIDGVSWRILAEDFETAVDQIQKNEEIRLPEKTASFMEWAEELEKYASSPSLDCDKAYWEKTIKQIIPITGITRSMEDIKDEDVVISFDSDTTQKLVLEAGTAYSTEVNDLLLAALTTAIYRWKSDKKIVICLEGHGREPIEDDINITSTVGWFTTQYPVVFDCSEDIQESIVSVKEKLRAVPNKGLKFGLLYSEKDYIQPDICFNYLGQIGDLKSDNSTKDQIAYSAGQNIAKENKSVSNILFNGIIANGVLNIQLSYDKKFASFEEMTSLAKLYEKALVEMIKHCILKDDTSITISDLEDSDINENELDLINSFF
ncbi:hypothetical protein ABE61_18725, partial [Lysinibacillus sphaericus]|uniref:condensation domain-containing protein n=1 Tax=Lysinibacillus sphaericus TaxID=1421 RepID=UPI001DB04FDE